MRRVTVHPHRERLDRLRPVAVPRPLDGGPNGVEHGQGIGAVDALGGNRPAAVDALRDVRVHHLAARRASSTSSGSPGSRRRPGTCQTAARLSPSCVSPTENAPSPRKVIATRGCPRRLNASAAPADERHEVAEHRDEREDAVRRRAEVHVAVAAEGRARRLAEEVAERVGGRRAAREVARELTVERGDDVVRAERVARRRPPRPPGRGPCRPSPGCGPGGTAPARDPRRCAAGGRAGTAPRGRRR